MRIAITGTPGVGKTTVSKVLGNKFGIKVIDITEAVKKHKLYTEKDEEMDSYVIDFEKLENFIKEIEEKEKVIILDGHVSHLLNPDYTIVLRCNPEIIKERLEKRGYKPKKVLENIQAEILDVCLCESKGKIYEIDTTGRDVEDIVSEIIEAIKNKKERKGIVDWTEKYFDYLTLEIR
ncbi:adenylate kinase family protein [Methanocaldococcus fervens]|uniref:Putative adenylate kinase n=1 Tax=Methanocaldococcus fervens (strain DSM 4213 / JCM 15782 / AG86) TaxID=573064 RepID=C7P5X1_METFA|nr:adenylate kinase family protein [Methanocaldococcus fervens]ACV23953.1 Adenylate kinase [Methanocaldococcus fervens AG86]